MKAYSGVAVLTVTSCLFIFTFVTCSPKCVVRARVVDAETRQPIKGAAVAIKWYTDASAQQPAETVAAIQSLSDDMGVFKIPEYPDKKYILGVYKNGYICWSSRDIFSNQEAAATRKNYRQIKDSQIKDGMEIRLVPFNKEHSRPLHAGFAVMVAGDSTNHPDGPFHQAIAPEFHLWRENLRQDFQKQIGTK
jgi:hypothetical protein